MRVLIIITMLWAAAPAAVLAQEAELVHYDVLEAGGSRAAGGFELSGGAAPAPQSGASRAGGRRPPKDGFYHIRFVADSGAADHARQFSELLLFHPAFMTVRHRFAVDMVIADPGRMGCGLNTPAAPRLVTCDGEYILSLGSAAAHITGVFTSMASGGSGGAGGKIAVASADYPLNTMLHEMLHVWGLQDEYTYSEAEAQHFCRHPAILKAANTVSMSPVEPFLSDNHARDLLDREIPWMREIQPDIPITAPVETPEETGAWLALGTPEALDQDEPGLYPGGNCSRVLRSFRPYKRYTIMKTLSSTWIPPIHRRAVLAEIARAAGWDADSVEGNW